MLLAANIGSIQGPPSQCANESFPYDQCSCFFIPCSLLVLLSSETVEAVDNTNRTWYLLASLPLYELHVPLGKIALIALLIMHSTICNSFSLQCDILGLLSHLFKGAARLFEG